MNQIPSYSSQILHMGNIIKLEVGNILLFGGDAIVNPANQSLLRGSGLCGAIHMASGAEQLQLSCKALGGCKTGEAKTTAAFELPCKWIIHAVGPNWYQPSPAESAELLTATYQAIFREAAQYKVTRLAIPAIGTGINGVPIDLAANIAIRKVVSCIKSNPTFEDVHFIFSDQAKCESYRQELFKIQS